MVAILVGPTEIMHHSRIVSKATSKVLVVALIESNSFTAHRSESIQSVLLDCASAYRVNPRMQLLLRVVHSHLCKVKHADADVIVNVCVIRVIVAVFLWHGCKPLARQVNIP